MPNDTSTLSGALLEMKDQLIYELGQKGVTAQYDSTTGLLGLIGRISDIQTGGSCYHIEFSESSYTAVGGSATLEIMLQENYAPKSGATVTVTGSDSSLYTGITDSSGVATVTVSVSAETTFTASYSNVSATCTVIVSSVIFSDDATVNNRDTLFGASSISLRNSGTSTATWNSASPSYYQIKVTRSSSESFIEYLPMRGITDSFKLTLKYKLPSTSSVCNVGLYYYLDSNNWGGVKGLNDAQWISTKTSGTFAEQEYRTGQSVSTNYFTHEIVYDKTANTLTISTYNSSNTLIQSKTLNVPITLTSSVKWGTGSTWSNGDKNNIYLLKAEYI